MLALGVTLILYVAAFPCFYGVVRLAVRHGLQDAAEAPRQTAVWQDEMFSVQG